MRLFETDVASRGNARNVVGDLVEEMTAKLTGAERLKTDGRCEVCPDLKWSDDTFFESKSVGRTNGVILYKHRIEKERKFCDQNREIFYWIWNHSAEISKCSTVDQLYRLVCLSIRSVVVVRRSCLDGLVSHQAGVARMINAAYYSNHGKVLKGVGWVLSINKIPSVQIASFEIAGRVVPVMSNDLFACRFISRKKIEIPHQTRAIRGRLF